MLREQSQQEHKPISLRIKEAEASFTIAERRIGKVLTAGQPTAGLATVAELARQADTSGATILRFVAKLGFASYPRFQEALRNELTARLDSPLAKIQSIESEGKGSMAQYANWASQLMRQAGEMIPETELEAVVHLFEDERRPVFLLGGRFSRSIAELMSFGLSGLRGKVHLLSGDRQDMVHALLDIGKRDIVVVFDFRRYQEDVIRFAEQARAAGAIIIVITDKWLSPAASYARYVFALPVASPSIYDSALAPVMCVEAILAQLAERIDGRARGRIAGVEKLYNRLS